MRETAMRSSSGQGAWPTSPVAALGVALIALGCIWGAGSAAAQTGAPTVPLSSTVPAPTALATFDDVPFGVRSVGMEGVSVFSAAELLAFAAALHHTDVAHRLTAQSVANAIALMYREDGYPLAEVSWRADAASASLVWVVNEGHIERVTLSGLDEATTARTLRYLQPLKAQRPLRQADLERALALADDLAGTSLSSRLVPVAGSMGSELRVTGHITPGRGGLVLDVVPLRPGYARRLHWHDERYGLLQPGDLTRVYATATHDPMGGHSLLGGLQHRTPLGDQGAYLEVLAGNARAERGLSLTPDRSELRGRNASLAWGYPFERDLHGYAYWIVALDHADATARLASSAPRSEATALRLYLVQGHTGSDEHLLQYAITASAGARPRSATGDGQRHFGHLRAGLGLAGPWNTDKHVFTYRFEGAVQWTRQSLPRVERFVVGHYPYLRGYAPAEVDGDRGAGFTLEVAYQGDVQTGLSTIKPFGFVSAAHVSSSVGTARARSWSLASVGMGLRSSLGQRWGIEAWAAVPLRDGPQSSSGSPAFFVSLSTGW